MTSVLYLVKTTVDLNLDAEFNRWYNEEHAPQHLEFRGCVAARRYRILRTKDRFKYLAVYEYEDEAALQRWLDSSRRQELIADHTARFGKPESSTEVVAQIWPAP